MQAKSKNLLKNVLVFGGIFLLFCAPAFFLKKTPISQKVSLQFPKQSRQLASAAHAEAEVAQKSCKEESRWLYRCDQNKKNCVKERRETFLSCKKL